MDASCEDLEVGRQLPFLAHLLSTPPYPPPPLCFSPINTSYITTPINTSYIITPINTPCISTPCINTPYIATL